jgi:hypothetical protein
MTTDEEYWLQQVRAEHIMEAVEAGWYMRERGGITRNELTEYAYIGSSYAQRALKLAVQFKMMTENEDRYLTVDRLSMIDRASRENWPALFGRFLPNYKPFITFVAMLSKGGTPAEASRKVKVIYSLSASDDSIRRTLGNWGEYADVLEVLENGSITIRIQTDKLEAEAIRELLEAMQNDIRAHIYLNGKLGEDLYAFIPSDSLDSLVSSIRNYERDARKSVADGFRSLEDFLRKVLTEKGQDASKCTGISSLLAELSRGGHILSKQVAIGSGLGAIRNAAAHGDDKDTGKPWIINADAAIESILLSMTLARSIHRFIHDEVQSV